MKKKDIKQIKILIGNRIIGKSSKLQNSILFAYLSYSLIPKKFQSPEVFTILLKKELE